MITPSMRPEAYRPSKHHMNYTGEEWKRGTRGHQLLRLHSSFMLHTIRYAHDMLHESMQPLPPPIAKVTDALIDIGKGADQWSDDKTRVNHMLDQMALFAFHNSSPEQADNMLEVASHYAGQLAILDFHKGLIVPITRYGGKR